jgi:hypothetical protein
MPKYPFEVPFEEILQDAERYVDGIFSCLESEFLVMPKGVGFIEYPVFERGYEALKAATRGFSELEPARVLVIALAEPISLVVLRTMLGFTPPDWGYVTTRRTGVSVTQGFVRTLDRRVRMFPETPLTATGATRERLRALVETACVMLAHGAPQVEDDQMHRLNKADTRRGLDSIQNAAGMGVPYAMLL